MRSVLWLACCLAVGCDDPAPKGASSAAPSALETAASAGLALGKPAPDVTLTLHDGAKQKLSSLQGGQVLLYFYPMDDTPGCTVEAQGFRDSYPALEKAGVKIYGVSTQDADSHQAFIDKHSLPFPLVVDEDGSVAAAFEVPVRVGGFAARHSILIAQDGTVKAIWRDVDPSKHAAEVLEKAKG